MHELHVLVLPSWYPTTRLPLNGIFFKEQVQALHRAGVRVGIAFPEILALRMMNWSYLRNFRFQVTCGEEDGVPTCRLKGWNLIPRLPLKHALWVQFMLKAVEGYVER